MQDKKKIKLFWGVGIGSIVLIFSTLFFIGFHFFKDNTSTTSSQLSQERPVEESRTTSSTLDSSTTGTARSQEDSSVVTREIDSSDTIKKFLNVYFTWDLDENSVNNRGKKLKGFMAKELYESKNIEADSETLNELIHTYKETKEINTSNSTQLISSRYVSSKVYQDTIDPNLYRINVKLQQKAPYQGAASLKTETYNIHFDKDKVTRMDKENE
ncbi:hypothetical protein MCG01_05385 [Enterococcus hirae]|nr:hypothetical protein [Enterococcus hirae]